MEAIDYLKGSDSLAAVGYNRKKKPFVVYSSSSGAGVFNVKKVRYSVDQLGRLIGAVTQRYNYDKAGNMVSSPTAGLTYDAADQLTRVGETPVAYDALGDRVTETPSVGTPNKYGYNSTGGLASFARSVEGVTREGQYTYNAEGLLSGITPKAQASAYMTWDHSSELPTLLNDGKNSYVYGPGGTALEEVAQSGEVLYLHHDQLGSTRLITSTSGTVLGTFTYGPYGELTARTGTVETPLGFDGELTDHESGLVYMRSRWYDPATGQFMTPDPLSALTGEPYQFANDNPTVYIDPSGLLFRTRAPRRSAKSAASSPNTGVPLRGCPDRRHGGRLRDPRHRRRLRRLHRRQHRAESGLGHNRNRVYGEKGSARRSQCSSRGERRRCDSEPTAPSQISRRSIQPMLRQGTLPRCWAPPAPFRRWL